MSLLKVEHLEKFFYSAIDKKITYAVKDMSFQLNSGEFLGIVGESGCGKSTTAKMIIGLLQPDSGEIYFEDKLLKQPYNKDVYKSMQMVFQLPKDSFDPRRTIGYALTTIQRNFGMGRQEAKQKAISLLQRVGLPTDYMEKYPHQLSGGECQRAAIARAISVLPRLIICDEITSALDVSIQAQVIELLLILKKELDISVLFISHDLALVQGICDRILVMYQGTIIEQGTGAELIHNPKEDYTKILFSSIYDLGALKMQEKLKQ